MRKTQKTQRTTGIIKANLSHISCVNRDVKSFEDIQSTKPITTLDASQNPIIDFTGISANRFMSLTSLVLSYTQIESFKGIQPLPSLESLQMFDTPLSEMR